MGKGSLIIGHPPFRGKQKTANKLQMRLICVFKIYYGVCIEKTASGLKKKCVQYYVCLLKNRIKLSIEKTGKVAGKEIAGKENRR